MSRIWAVWKLLWPGMLMVKLLSLSSLTPGVAEQPFEQAVSFSSWDTFFYTRSFRSVDSDRSMRHVSKLLTYPVTIAGVLHQNGPYTYGNGRITTEGRRSMAGESTGILIFLHDLSISFRRSHFAHQPTLTPKQLSIQCYTFHQVPRNKPPPSDPNLHSESSFSALEQNQPYLPAYGNNSPTSSPEPTSTSTSSVPKSVYPSSSLKEETPLIGLKRTNMACRVTS